MSKRAASVFLNVPFDGAYERFFVALIATIVAVGRTPRCVLELPEHGLGRLDRLIKHLRACSLSIHDLSRVGMPPRFNMPFELGLAVALGKVDARHHYVLLERKAYRLDRTLSDIKGRDPLIYEAKVRLLISSLLGALQRPTRAAVDPSTVLDVHRQLMRVSTELKTRHGSTTIFTPAIFRDLVGSATIVAEDYGVLSPVNGKRSRLAA